MKKLKEKLSAKLSKNGGFTLVEMLIVVAIIAILIAVSIPLVGSTLERAREATDAANERAFKATLISGYLLNEAKMTPTAGGIKVAVGTIYAYDAVNGKASSDKIAAGYGKSSATSGSSNVDCAGKVLYGKITSTGEVSMVWGSANVELSSVTVNDTQATDSLVSQDLTAETA